MLPPSIQLTQTPGKALQEFISTNTYSSIGVLVDDNTKQLCYPLIQGQLPAHQLITVSPGEEFKTLESCAAIWRKMTSIAMDRHSVLVILGGGVLCDMGGFCASTYKRGIDFIFIPTTLLAQADASIGGKLGIDFLHYKNQIGLFREPVLNLISSEFLKSLPLRELRSGFAEIIKHAIIADKNLWNTLRTHDLGNQPWDLLLQKSTEFKYSIVRQDPFEKGIRKILNAGHTIGHALESYFLSNNKRILHGEAVAAGLVMEAHLAVTRNLLDEKSFQDLTDYVFRIFGKLEISPEAVKGITELSLQDKKNKGNKVLCTLPKGIGNAVWDVEISVGEIGESLSFYRLLQT